MARRVHLPRPAVKLALFSGVAGLIAAALSFAARRTLDDDWAALAGDLVRVVLLVVVLGVVTAWVTDRQRAADELAAAAVQAARNRVRVARWSLLSRLTASAWNVLPTDDLSAPATPGEAAGVLRSGANELRELHAKVDTVHAAPLTSDEEQVIAFIKLEQLARELALYAAEGMRARRFERLDRLAAELRELADDSDPGWSDRVQAFRSAAFAALGWRSHTDAVIVERLVVELAIKSGSDPRPADDPARALRSASGMDVVVAAVEPLWLLVGYIAVHCAGLRPGNWPAPEVLDVVRRALGALRNEVFMIAAAYDALAEVLEHADQPAATSS